MSKSQKAVKQMKAKKQKNTTHKSLPTFETSGTTTQVSVNMAIHHYQLLAFLKSETGLSHKDILLQGLYLFTETKGYK